ncbi:PilZ domain-containing protein [Ramlibacter sp. AN1015]|uniref:PilZ domain-containing protein n=1 Tax=Ramlibacter sp. AN1015 TaxID=3133428 RepID=UPI0030C33623
MLHFDRRCEPREALCLLLRLADGSRARTVNASCHGLYLLVPRSVRIDSWIALDLAWPPGGVRVRVLAQVLRIQARGTRSQGVALRLHRHTVSPLTPGRW